ncbi:hypothetical protein AO262_13550 [Pseudomonas fluorescens ABAC62]|nr:hypothetical protein AO262_13550 [Pseudomonas fluorescens ABAC62]
MNLVPYFVSTDQQSSYISRLKLFNSLTYTRIVQKTDRRLRKSLNSACSCLGIYNGQEVEKSSQV